MKEKQVHKKQFGWGYILFGILLIVVGGCFVGIHDTFDKLAIVVGAFAIVFGGILFLVSLFSKGNGIVFIFKFVLNAAIIAGGVFTIIYKEPAIRILMDVFCLLLIVDGAFKLQDSVRAKGKKVALWWFIAFLSLCVIGVAFFMTKRSFNDEKTRSIVFGCTVIVDGISNFLTSFLLRQKENNEVAEIVQELKDQEKQKDMDDLKEKMDEMKKEMEEMKKSKTYDDESPAETVANEKNAPEETNDADTEKECAEAEVATATAEEQETIKTPETPNDEKTDEKAPQEPLEENVEEKEMTVEEEQEVDVFFGGDLTVVALDETPSEKENENEKNETNE